LVDLSFNRINAAESCLQRVKNLERWMGKDTLRKGFRIEPNVEAEEALTTGNKKRADHPASPHHHTPNFY
jgi:hypothetical protein